MSVKLKMFLGVAAVLVVAAAIAIINRPVKPAADNILNASRGPSFDVRVAVPRMGRPLAGILPDWVVKKMDATPGELRFDHTTAGAQIGSIENHRVELRADGWELVIESDSQGRVGSGTRLVFPLALGGRHLRLNCRPDRRDAGYLDTTTRAGSNLLVGRFVVEVSACRNAESGKTSNWPPAPLTVSGSFVSQPKLPSPERQSPTPTN